MHRGCSKVVGELRVSESLCLLLVTRPGNHVVVLCEPISIVVGPVAIDMPVGGAISLAISLAVGHRAHLEDWQRSSPLDCWFEMELGLKVLTDVLE